MSKRSCSQCLYAESCTGPLPCKYFFPLDEYEYEEELIERGREQFNIEWSAYMKESQDSDF